jgi:hypothetical protein
MTEWWMPDVMHQRQRLDQIDVQSELRGNGTRNLRHLERVCQAIAKVVGIAASENLRLGFQTPKGAGVDDAVAVALKVVAVGMWRFRMTPAKRMLDGIGSKHEVSVAEKTLSSQYSANRESR